MSSCCQSCSSSGWPTSLPSGTRQTCWINAITSAAVTLSSVGFGLRLATLDLPRSPLSGSLQDSRTRRPRYSARAGRRTQLGEQIGDGLSREIVFDSESAGLFAAILILRPELTKPHLEPLGDGGLRS